MKKVLKFIGAFNWKTLFLNIKYLPLKQAMRFPILCSSKCRIRRGKGKAFILGPIRTGMIRIGFDSVGIFDNKRSRSIWEVYGQVFFMEQQVLGTVQKSVFCGGGIEFWSKFLYNSRIINCV